MLYWDSSALVACFIMESKTEEIRFFISKVGEVRSYTAILTPLEVESAIQRRFKENSITPQQLNQARLLLLDFRKQSYFVMMDSNVLDMALHFQKIYGLRVADSIQLASARVGTNEPSKIDFLCLDDKLNEAARHEGFQIAFSLSK